MSVDQTFPSFFHNGTNSRMPASMAPQSAIGVAHVMASAPPRASRRNMNGTSSPPFLSMDNTSGFPFCPTDWNMEIMTVVMAVNGPVIQMILVVPHGLGVINEQGIGAGEQQNCSDRRDGKAHDQRHLDGGAHTSRVFCGVIISDQRDDALRKTVGDGKGQRTALYLDVASYTLLGVQFHAFHTKKRQIQHKTKAVLSTF